MNRRILVFLLVLACALMVYARRRPKLHNKQYVDYDVELLSYVVCLLDKGIVRECTGTLIKTQWVLTAAHCILGNDITHIQYGNISVSPRISKSKSVVIDKIPHPNYRFGETLTDDIGLLRVYQVPMAGFPVVLGKHYQRLVGLPVEYTGFFSTFSLAKNRPLRICNGMVTSCESVREVQLKRFFLCVVGTDKGKLSSCPRFPEDSGGPLFWNGKIAAVTSWGSGDGTIPDGVYTPISPYKIWIHKVIKAMSHIKEKPIIKQLC